MDIEARALLAVAARLADYPGDGFAAELAELREFAAEHFSFGPLRFALNGLLDELGTLPLREVQEQYVAAFDLKDRTGLYLTAHELGDSRGRGVALLELRWQLQMSGFEPLEGHLPDYLPMLYEWAAELPDSDAHWRLAARLAFATQRIRTHLADSNPFKPLFEALMTAVFDELPEQRMQELERKREKPDLDPMPYPLMCESDPRSSTMASSSPSSVM
jgi:nitrate reductase delta subunit